MRRTYRRRFAAAVFTPLLMATAAVTAIQAPAQALQTVNWGAGNYVIARHYEHTSWNGAQAIRVFVNSACSEYPLDADSGGYPGQYLVDHHGTLEQSNWNNNISSVRHYRGCIGAHFDRTDCNFRGTGDFHVAETAASMPGFNDRTSCIVWT